MPKQLWPSISLDPNLQSNTACANYFRRCPFRTHIANVNKLKRRLKTVGYTIIWGHCGSHLAQWRCRHFGSVEDNVRYTEHRIRLQSCVRPTATILLMLMSRTNMPKFACTSFVSILCDVDPNDHFIMQGVA